MLLATLLYKSQGDCWEVLVISQEMIDRREQPRRLGPFPITEQHARYRGRKEGDIPTLLQMGKERDALIEQAFPGITAANWCVAREMRAYLLNAGYTQVEDIRP